MRRQAQQQEDEQEKNSNRNKKKGEEARNWLARARIVVSPSFIPLRALL